MEKTELEKKLEAKAHEKPEQSSETGDDAAADQPPAFIAVIRREAIPVNSGNCGNDADLIAVFQRRLLVFQEADVFLVHIDVNETANFAFLIHETFLDAGVAALQFGDCFSDGCAVDFDEFLVVGQLAERSWDSDFFWHNSASSSENYLVAENHNKPALAKYSLPFCVE